MSWIDRINEWMPEWIAKGLSCAPAYEPDKWNTDPKVRLANNCYNYACDIPTTNGKIAEPGFKARGFKVFEITAVAMRAAVEADGLREIGWGESCGCRECCHIVALAVVAGRYHADIPPHVPPEIQAVHPAGDYHFFRQDKDGLWSHKKGGAPATNMDDPPPTNPMGMGKLIVDPRNAKVYLPRLVIDATTKKAVTENAQYEICGFYCVNKKKLKTLDGP